MKDARVQEIFDYLGKEIHDTAVKKGFWTSENDGEKIALMHSELSEALEALREGRLLGDGSVGEELGDCVIRIFDYCQKKHINLCHFILAKMEKNKNRPHMHGKRF